MLVLNIEQLAAAKKLCELLLWQNLENVESAFSSFKDYLADDYGINNAFRMSMQRCFYTFDWNEYDLLFVDYLWTTVASLQIQLPNHLAEVEEISNSEAKDLFIDVCKVLAEHGFDVWWLASDMNCLCVVPQKLREEIIKAAITTKLGLSLPNYFNYTGFKSSNIYCS